MLTAMKSVYWSASSCGPPMSPKVLLTYVRGRESSSSARVRSISARTKFRPASSVPLISFATDHAKIEGWLASRCTISRSSGIQRSGSRQASCPQTEISAMLSIPISSRWSRRSGDCGTWWMRVMSAPARFMRSISARITDGGSVAPCTRSPGTRLKPTVRRRSPFSISPSGSISILRMPNRSETACERRPP